MLSFLVLKYFQVVLKQDSISHLLMMLYILPAVTSAYSGPGQPPIMGALDYPHHWTLAWSPVYPACCNISLLGPWTAPHHGSPGLPSPLDTGMKPSSGKWVHIPSDDGLALPKTMLIYCQLNPQEQALMEFRYFWNTWLFIQGNAFEKPFPKSVILFVGPPLFVTSALWQAGVPVGSSVL